MKTQYLFLSIFLLLLCLVSTFKNGHAREMKMEGYDKRPVAYTFSPDGPLIDAGFIFKPTSELPSNHASTVEEMPDGSILCAWYSGKKEAADDVAVYASRYVEGKWSKPKVIADTPGKPEGNPVLFTDRSGKTWLFFVTIHGMGWTMAKVKYRTSADAGHTWGPVEMLREKNGWMTRNHPITLHDGRILLPLYSEVKWCSEFMILDHGGSAWKHVGKLCSRPGNIQAAVVELEDFSLYATMRTGGRGGKLWQTRSFDAGRTWSKAEQMELPNPNAGTDMIKLSSGRLLLAFNNSEKKRTPLSLAQSYDGGKTWHVIKDVESEPGKYSYPSLCLTKDGVIHLTYTYNRETIKHIAFTEMWLQ